MLVMFPLAIEHMRPAWQYVSDEVSDSVAAERVQRRCRTAQRRVRGRTRWTTWRSLQTSSTNTHNQLTILLLTYCSFVLCFALLFCALLCFNLLCYVLCFALVYALTGNILMLGTVHGALYLSISFRYLSLCNGVAGMSCFALPCFFCFPKPSKANESAKRCC